MNSYNRVAIMKGLVDLMYSAAILGAVAYVMRGDLKAAFDRRRVVIEERIRIVDERRKREANGLGYLAAIRETIIAEEHGYPPIEIDGDYLGMEP